MNNKNGHKVFFNNKPLCSYIEWLKIKSFLLSYLIFLRKGCEAVEVRSKKEYEFLVNYQERRSTAKERWQRRKIMRSIKDVQQNNIKQRKL